MARDPSVFVHEKALCESDRVGPRTRVWAFAHIMPEATGSDFIRLVRKVNPEVPVIVISGLAEAEQEYAGMDILFRQKPCPPPE